jgi:NADPH:quinone reductase-like Zn-dependent oxidoreductase
MIEEPAMMAKSKQAEKGLMKAVIRERFGSPDVIQIKEVEKPGPNDIRGVLVKIYASSVNAADKHDMRGAFLLIRLVGPLFRLRMGVRRPKEPGLGTDFAGVVEAVHSDVTEFKPGDEVYGVANAAYAEYGLARDARIALRPKNTSFEQCAAVPIAGFTALQALRDHGRIKPGQKVLINGAGGGVGTFAVQIAKAFGAEVTAVTNPANLEMVRKLGADYVIDYTQEDYTKKGESYDLIVEIGASHSISDYKRIMNPNGAFVLVGFKDKIVRRLLSFIIRSRFASRGDKKFTFFIAKSNHDDLVVLKDFIEQEKVIPVIDRRYPLAETAQAIRYFEEGRTRGKIVITTDAGADKPVWSDSNTPSGRGTSR